MSTDLVRWALQPGRPGAGLKGGHGAQGSEVGAVWVGGSSRKLRCEKLCLLPVTGVFWDPFPLPSGASRVGLLRSLPFLTLAVSRGFSLSVTP